MAAYRQGERVAAVRDIKRRDLVLPRGSKGTVAADSGSRIATVRVSFDADTNLPYRVVPKRAITRR